ncbi:MAG: hypothetical protein K6B72_01315, partial [Lachnospiraceae bacterium]|nr:hypothetical protein [Lachnospiraceae bacterium]
MKIVKHITAWIICMLVTAAFIPAPTVRAAGDDDLVVGQWDLSYTKLIYSGNNRCWSEEQRNDPTHEAYYTQGRVHESNHVGNREAFAPGWDADMYLGRFKDVEYEQEDIRWTDPPAQIAVFSKNGPDTSAYEDVTIDTMTMSIDMDMNFHPFDHQFHAIQKWVGDESVIEGFEREDFDEWDSYYAPMGLVELELTSMEKGTELDSAYEEEHFSFASTYDGHYPLLVFRDYEDFDPSNPRKYSFYTDKGRVYDKDELTSQSRHFTLNLENLFRRNACEPFAESNKTNSLVNMLNQDQEIYPYNDSLVIWVHAQVMDAEVVMAYVYDYTPFYSKGKKVGSSKEEGLPFENPFKPLIQEDTTVAQDKPGEDTGTTINNEIIDGPKDKESDIPGAVATGVGGAIVAGGLAGAAAGKKKKKGKKDPEEEEEKDPVTYKMIIYKDFGDTLRPGDTKMVYARIEQYKPIQEAKSFRDDLTAQIQCDSPDGVMTVEDAGISTNGCDWKVAKVTVPEGCSYPQGAVSFILPGAGGTYIRHVIFKIENPAIIFGQENLGLPANHLNNTVELPGGSSVAEAVAAAKASGASPTAANGGPVARPVNGVFHLPFGVYGMPVEGTTVEIKLEQRCSTDSEGRFISGSTKHEKGCPYTVEVQPDPEYKDKGLWELLIREVLDYELDAGTTEGLMIHLTAKNGKEGTENFLKAEKDFPLYRIHMGLVLNVDTLSIPCYTELKESGKRKLSAQARAEAEKAQQIRREIGNKDANTTFASAPDGDDSVPEEGTTMSMSASEDDLSVDPDETKITPDDIQPVFGEGTLVLFVCRESDMSVLRIPVSPSDPAPVDAAGDKTAGKEKAMPGAPVKVTALEVANDKKSHIGEANESHQELVNKLQIRAFPTGRLTTSGAHKIRFCATAGALDPPTRIIVEIEVSAEYKKKIHTVKKKTLLRSQPFRQARNMDDEAKFLREDAKIADNLLHMQQQIQAHAMGSLFSVYNMIDRMLEGYDYRFGYDRNQLMNVTSCYIGYVRGTFLGANAQAQPVTLADDINACYAFLQGLRDNTGILGRVAMGIMTAGYSEYVFTTMTLAEEMRDRVFACQGDQDFGFWDAVQMGVKEFGKQVVIEALIGGVHIGKSVNVPGFAEIGGEYLLKVHNIDMAGTIKMWAGRYYKTMYKADIYLQKKLPLYKTANDFLQKGSNFFNSSANTARAAIEKEIKDAEIAAQGGDKLLTKARKNLTPEELKSVAEYEKAMADGMEDVRALQKAQQELEACTDIAQMDKMKANYRKCADKVWTNKNALKQLQRNKHPYAQRMRAQFNEYREMLLDEVQLEALGDVAKELGRPPEELYVMNVSNGINTDYKLGKKVPGDRDISFKQRVLSDKVGVKDLTIDQELGQRAVAKRLYKKMNGKEADTIEEALKFMKEKDVTYVNPESYARNADGTYNRYVFEHNLEGYEDLNSMVGMVPNPDGSRKMIVNKNLMKNDLHNLQVNRAAVKGKGTEWFVRDAGESLKQAKLLEAEAAKATGKTQQELLKRAQEFRNASYGQTVEGIRQITKQVDKIIEVRSMMRTGHSALTA